MNVQFEGVGDDEQYKLFQQFIEFQKFRKFHEQAGRGDQEGLRTSPRDDDVKPVTKDYVIGDSIQGEILKAEQLVSQITTARSNISSAQKTMTGDLEEIKQKITEMRHTKNKNLQTYADIQYKLDFYSTTGFTNEQLGEYPESMERFVQNSTENIIMCCCMPHKYANVRHERGKYVRNGLFEYLGCITETHENERKRPSECYPCKRVAYDDIPMLQ